MKLSTNAAASIAAYNTTVNSGGTGVTNNAVRIFMADNVTFIDTNITVIGSGDGISLTSDANNAMFINTTISVSSEDAIDLTQSNDSRFINTVLNNSPQWTRMASDAFRANFSNTSFITPNGRLVYPGNLQFNGTLDVNQSNINISSLRVFVNSSLLPSLNASAHIRFDGVILTLPNMRVDAEDDGTFLDCTSPKCTFVSYAGTTFAFNVSSFTTFILSSNSSADAGGPLPGTGGGGGGQTSRYVYSNTIHNPLPPPAPKVSPPIIVEPEPVIEVPVLEVPPPPAHYCGDGTCDRGEDSFSCSADCGVPPPPQAPQPVREPISWRTISGIFFGLALLLLVILALIKLYEHRTPKSAFTPVKKGYDSQVAELMGRMEQRAPPPPKNASQKKAPKQKKREV